MGLPELLGGATLGALVLYALLGGADYGGGVWDLLARGPRAAAQRDLIAHSIGPVWEANHVWLVLAVVLLFVCFPPAFARMGTELHIPLTLALVGIVLRGSAFTFRSYDLRQDEAQRRFGRVFAIASLLTPLLLGVVLGAIASGRLASPGDAMRRTFTERFVLPWVAPFPLAVGVFALVLFAYLAAVYLTLETDARELQEAFRRRALASGLLAGILALTVFLLSGRGAPTIREGLASSPWTWPLQLATAAAALGCLGGLATRRFRLARVCAGAQVTLILLGWGAAQYPRLIEPDLTLRGAAAPEATLRLVAWALLAGAAVLVPSLLYLFRVFKGGVIREPRPPAEP